MKKIKKMTLLAIFVSMALVLHVMENMLPIPYIAPGVKLGLANMVSLIVIVVFGVREALMVVLLRTFLGSLLGGVPSSFLFSAAGGILSTLVMYLVYSRLGAMFSLVGVSVAGAIAHNIGQLFVASVVVENFGLYVYLPVLMVSAVVTGVFIGLTASYSVGYVERNVDYSKKRR